MWQDLIDFLYNNWFKLGFLIWLFYIASGFGRGWFKEQIEWVKLIFVDDDDLTVANAPSHKNAVLIVLIIVFAIAFLKKVALETVLEVPDIPTGWQMVILVGLGIAAAKTGAQKLFENKWGNAQNNNETPSKP